MRKFLIYIVVIFLSTTAFSADETRISLMDTLKSFDGGQVDLEEECEEETFSLGSENLEVKNVKVSLTERKIYLFDSEGNKTKEYPCAIGRKGHETPVGEFKIFSKLKDPEWDNPFTAAVERISGPNSPIGTRFMGFEHSKEIPGAIYGFHGTNKPSSIGKAASTGCLRMHKKDLEEFFDLVKEGTPVKIEK